MEPTKVPPIGKNTEFPESSYAQWETAALSALRGEALSTLQLITADGIHIDPLYLRPGANATTLSPHLDTRPGEFPFRRSANSQASSGWQVRQRYQHPDPSYCNSQILTELNRGVTQLHLDYATTEYSAQMPITRSGIVIQTQSNLDTTLNGVMLDMVRICLSAGHQFDDAINHLKQSWKNQQLTDEQCQASFGIDPLTSGAFSGRTANIEQQLTSLGNIALVSSQRWKHVNSCQVDASNYHNAGATPAQELGFMLSTGKAYLDAMLGAGIGIDEACKQLEFTLAVDTDYFLSATKMRSARELWASLCTACGASPSMAKAKLVARTSTSMMASEDPWSNLLRTTLASTAAAVGGADAITVHDFDCAADITEAPGRRLSRNCAIILKDESRLHRVVDPLGGSGFIESLTDQLCERAWNVFTDIEQNGGMLATIRDGHIKTWVESSRKATKLTIESGQQKIVGVTDFLLPENPSYAAQPNRDEGAYKLAEQAATSAMATPAQNESPALEFWQRNGGSAL